MLKTGEVRRHGLPGRLRETRDGLGWRGRSSDPAVTLSSWTRPWDPTSRLDRTEESSRLNLHLPLTPARQPKVSPHPTPLPLAVPELQAGFCVRPRPSGRGRAPRGRTNEARLGRGGACAGPGSGGGRECPAGAGARGRCPGPASPAGESRIPWSEPAPRAGPGAVPPLPPLLAAAGRGRSGSWRLRLLAERPGAAPGSRGLFPHVVCPRSAGRRGGGKGDLPAVAPRASIVVSNIKLTSSSGKKISLLFSFPPTTSSPPAPLPPPPLKKSKARRTFAKNKNNKNSSPPR